MVKDYVLIAVIIVLGAVIVELGFGDHNLGALGADEFSSDLGEESEVNQSLEKDDVESGANKISVSEDGFNYDNMTLQDGDVLWVENRDTKEHQIRIEKLEVYNYLSPNSSMEIKVEAGDYSLETPEFENQSVQLDVSGNSNSTGEDAETKVGYPGDELVIYENSFSYSRMELVEGDNLKIENRDETAYSISVPGLEVERRLSPGEEIDIEVQAGDYQLSSSEISDETVYLDINLG